MTTIAQIMTRNPVTCAHGSTLNEAAQRMWDHDIGALPVTDDRGCPVGVITDRDIAMAAYTQGRPLHEVAVASAMSRTVLSLREDASVSEAQGMMQQHQIRRVPVVDDQGRTVGIVSINDLIRSVGSGRKGEVSATELASTLRAVCKPRASQGRAAFAAE